MRLCSIDFPQGDFNQKGGQQNQQGQQKGQQNNNNRKPKQDNKQKQSYNIPLDKFRGETVPVIKKTESGDIGLTREPSGLSKSSDEAIKSNIEAQKDEFVLRGAKARHEAAPILKAEKRSKALSDVLTKGKEVAKQAIQDPGAAVDKVTSESKKFLFGDGQKKGLAKALKETKESLDTTVSRIAYGKELNPKKKSDQKKLQKITGESVGEKGVKKAYKQVGKEISSNISTARDIGIGIKDAINPNAKFKRIAKYGKGGEVSRLGRAISRGDTFLGDSWFTKKVVGGILQKGGGAAMQKKATKDYERKQTLKSMRGFSEEEMRVYDEIFKALIEEDFTTVKPGDQSEKPISEEVLKELIDTNFYEANDSEEKKYHESVVKGYSFNESTGRYESLSREIFGEA